MQAERKNFYVVKNCPEPGIFTRWSEAKTKIDKYTGCQYKGFVTMAEAQTYLNQNTVTKYYAVKVGRTPGIYTNWPQAKAQVEGIKAMYKSFPTKTEAEAYMGIPEAKPSVASNQDVDITGTTIWCDGSAFGNKTKLGQAGWAVVVKQDGETVHTESDTVPLGANGEKPTNQRAELTALLNALNMAKSLGATAISPVRIYSDSEYSIKCLTVWSKNWKMQGGCLVKSNGDMVANQDIIIPMLTLFNPNSMDIRHVYGHNNVAGNEEADQLAKQIANSISSKPVTPPADLESFDTPDGFSFDFDFNDIPDY